MARPVIAITGPEKGAFGPRSTVALAVWLYGGKPLQIRPSQIDETFDYQGVVVTGGHDIDPVLYAAEPEVEPRYDRARDALEARVIKDALARGLPLLGICRGAQLLNASLGGSLFQDLRPHRDKTSHRRTLLPLKTLQVVRGSGLERLFGAGTCRINSLHNQAIDRVGANLVITGRDLDGIVQSVEDPDQGFLVGVQWHPEFLLFMRRHRGLFKALLEQVKHNRESDGSFA
ncbi:gamma-glutamyl-gamma-aminobutyrate hydrolase family protein [Marinimicrobium sp. ABcell2]|uniref:gamma-glutamyl-gamma-aminobutyrate hydrolase family protein n=1 Tax=Marinimicrobium sp. ABcell2 TaxID=3069751 RepID=UPI0027B33AC5|nr:gamma-glutamyl-gamma-aminobutyrate hydrolase family protein [Marinimicrobium sp. ABcell2]MDQ2075934.1 gamma-glutamyl-gamma-aminobutyrate hydrolase family protein [Marinimicrobium sp. ABcell2]